MKKLISVKQAINRLQKELDSMLTKAQQEHLNWSEDKESKDTYTRAFSDRKRAVELVCSLKTGIITRCVSPL